MTYTVRFLPEIEEDVMAGFLWYEEKAPGLGEEFLRMFDASIGALQRNPHIYRKVARKFRRCLLRRFPYAIYFWLQTNEIIVSGLFHCARDPYAISEQLQNRSER